MLAVRYWVDEDVILRVWVLPSYSVGRMQCVLLKFKVPMASMTVRNVVNKTCPNETRIVETNLHLSLAITCHRILKISLDFAPTATIHGNPMLRACYKLRHFSSMPPRQPIVAIVGSTGTGKSDVHLTGMPPTHTPRLTTAAS